MHYRSYLSSSRQLLTLRRAVLAMTLAFLVAGSVCAEAATPTPAAAPATPAADPSISVFVDDPNFGRDPFFPKSQRRKRTAVVEDTNVVTTVQVDDLVLKGLSGSPGRRLAIINNYTFEAGEEYVLRMANGPVKVRCIEIRDRSVVISINGVTKELRMREKL